MKRILFAMACIPAALFAQQAPGVAAENPAAPTAAAPVQATAPVPATGSTPASTVPGILPPPGQIIPTLPPLPAVGEAAYKQVRDTLAPLTPDQIRDLRRLADDSERAASDAPRFVPKTVSSSLVAVLSPGAVPPVVRLFANYVTALVFIDESGRPLAIQSVDVAGGKDIFSVTWTAPEKGQDGPNSLSMSPNRPYATGNVLIRLQGVSKPVSVTLVTGQREVDSSAEIRVAGIGASRSESLPGSASSGLQAFLDGVPPKNAKALTSSAGTVQIWSMDGHFVVRTGPELALVSPAFTERKSSADGTTIYVVPAVSPLIALNDGSPITVTVGGY